MTQAQKQEKESRYDIDLERPDRSFTDEIEADMRNHIAEQPAENQEVVKQLTEAERIKTVVDQRLREEELIDEEEDDDVDEEFDEDDDDYSVADTVTGGHYRHTFSPIKMFAGMVSLIIAVVVGWMVIKPVTEIVLENSMNVSGTTSVTSILSGPMGTAMFSFLPIIVVGVVIMSMFRMIRI